jgi:hypothetical protein
MAGFCALFILRPQEFGQNATFGVRRYDSVRGGNTALPAKVRLLTSMQGGYCP